MSVVGRLRSCLTQCRAAEKKTRDILDSMDPFDLPLGSHNLIADAPSLFIARVVHKAWHRIRGGAGRIYLKELLEPHGAQVARADCE